MGHYVHFSATFSGDSFHIETIRPLIASYLNTENSTDRYSKMLLEAMLDPRNYSCGPKGELFSWGIVGNYTSVEEVARELLPLFGDLLKAGRYLSRHDHVILFEEKEQSEQAIAYEIFLDDQRETPRLEIHKLPFCWGQS